ncbi:hypothetical protein L6164_000165 [Bauhinia variegata]|uniref:Uncharacterized protein n=1 Tax=Bauhinia variegata TaxID=167791 RepID=A0ACB9Q5Y2_BAUVA|nr:hypothetical protein L6164_000165 [Bauhinia variegata]
MMVAFSTITRPLSFHSPTLLGLCIFRQVPSKLSSLGKMSTSKKGNSTIHRDPVMVDGPLFYSCLDNGGFIVVGTVCVTLRNQPLQNVQSSSLSSARCNSSTEKFSECKSMSDPAHSSLPNNAQSKKTQIHRTTRVDLGSKNSSEVTSGVYTFSSSPEKNGLSHSKKFPARNFTSQLNEASLPSEFVKKKWVGSPNRPHSRQGNSNYSPASDKLDSSPSFPKFDICRWGRVTYALLEASPHSENRESCTEMQGVTKQRILRSGMVLLRHYISLNEQAEIVKSCRKLGLGSGGFYQPGYENGAKYRLQMMCLGLDWDPQTRKHGKKRSIDDSEPPGIPDKFTMSVKGAMQEAHSLFKKEARLSNVEDMLPSMNPNICIVNFYSTNGRLGLIRSAHCSITLPCSSSSLA